jgi:Type I phosphodiesterase / nucleotide pyrophosphatase
VTGVNDLRWLLSSVALSAGLSVAQAAQLQLSPVKHVLLISVDGLHQQDLALYVRAHPKSAMANLAAQGLTYTGARSGLPSDSFPGLLALITGGTPRSTGVYYDDSYDRLLAAPGSDCKVAGTELLYDESIDKNPDVLDGGGGIDPLKLPRDPARGCAPVYPHSALRVNTIFWDPDKSLHMQRWAGAVLRSVPATTPGRSEQACLEARRFGEEHCIFGGPPGGVPV